MQQQGEWRKRKGEKTREAKSMKKASALTYSLPFERVGAALLIRTDATHRAKEVRGDASSL